MRQEKMPPCRGIRTSLAIRIRFVKEGDKKWEWGGRVEEGKEENRRPASIRSASESLLQQRGRDREVKKGDQKGGMSSTSRG